MMFNDMLGDAMFMGSAQMVAEAVCLCVCMRGLMFVRFIDCKYLCVQLLRGGRSAYVYLFNNVASDAFLKLIGPGHTMDLPFIFNDVPTFLETVKSKFLPEEKPTFTATEQALAEQVAQYWLNFARHLDPSPVQSSLPPWLPTTRDSTAWMEFTNDQAVPRSQPYYHNSQVKFWLKIHEDQVAATSSTECKLVHSS